MCTVSWLHTPDGYHLLCNRDERFTRQPAFGFRAHTRRGTRFISPRDGDQGGTWLAANEFGVTLCLVNRYPCRVCNGQETRQYRSRGLLVFDLADSKSLVEARQRLERARLHCYRPFSIVVLEPGQAGLLFHWTGRYSLLECNGDPSMPLISSSFDQKGVEVYRRRLFHKLVGSRQSLDLDALMAFHASHLPVESAYSTCMHREDAATVSFSWIEVTSKQVDFRYWPGPPCALQLEPNAASLKRRLPMAVAGPANRSLRPSVARQSEPSP
ncbi:MAG: NRDE family protein [Acidobacteriota bacterium]